MITVGTKLTMQADGLNGVMTVTAIEPGDPDMPFYEGDIVRVHETIHEPDGKTHEYDTFFMSHKLVDGKLVYNGWTWTVMGKLTDDQVGDCADLIGKSRETVAPAFLAGYDAKATERHAAHVARMANYSKFSGITLTVELHRQGDTLSYVLTGAGIAEQVGTTHMSEADLLDVLLSPLGAKVDGANIVQA